MADSPVVLSVDPAGLQVAANLTKIALILLERAPDGAVERIWEEFLEFVDRVDRFHAGVAGAFGKIKKGADALRDRVEGAPK